VRFVSLYLHVWILLHFGSFVFCMDICARVLFGYFLQQNRSYVFVTLYDEARVLYIDSKKYFLAVEIFYVTC